jgi:hypothetical protein
MTTIVIGGHSRKVGKTSVTAGLIRAFSQYRWTALKISSHWHDVPPNEDICVILEEHVSGEQSDTARFLAAGAARSFWIRVRDDQAGTAMPKLLPILQSSPFVIIESNCILRHIQTDLYIMVLRYDVDDFKESARETLSRANAVVAIDRDIARPAWADFAREKLAGIPLFVSSDPLIIPSGLLDLVSSRL